jgi:hypothetical protein
MGHEFSQILANGEVRFCCYCLLPMGNLHERSFAEIWSGAPYQAVRREAMMLPIRRPTGAEASGGSPRRMWRCTGNCMETVR